MKLKVDFHTHTSDDLVEEVVSGRNNLPSPFELVDLAIARQFDAIAITHHGIIYRNDELNDYAAKRGLLIIPGVEAFIESKHVLLINYPMVKPFLKYQDLCKHRREHGLIIAPHPFYVQGKCVGKNLIRYHQCFDAVEYSRFHYKTINPARKALRIARRFNLPVVGCSDAHEAYQFGATYSIVDAEAKSVTAIVRAVKQGKVEFVSDNDSLLHFIKDIYWTIKTFPLDAWKFTQRIRESFL
ncbi:MAG: PHP domain-containing protein [bacterium]|nr:PHP domain-containing protein [bacterium]